MLPPPKVDLCLGFVSWRRICAGHWIFFGTQLDNHPFYLWQLEDSRAQVRACSFVWFYWYCAKNVTRKLSCSFQEKGNYLLKIMSKLDISTLEVYMARKHSPRIPEEHFKFRPAPAAAVVLNQNRRCAGVQVCAGFVPRCRKSNWLEI